MNLTTRAARRIGVAACATRPVLSAAAYGKKIAVQKTTVGVPDIQKRSEDGQAAGKPEVTIDQYQGQDEATASVVSAKGQAMPADLPSSAYAVQQTVNPAE